MLKKNVLRRKEDFSAIYNRGKSIGERYIVLFYRKNNLGYTRKAFLASKKVGNAVTRNRARRLMKESVRQLEGRFPKGYDYIFIARNTIAGSKCADVQKSIESAFKRTGLVKEAELRRETKWNDWWFSWFGDIRSLSRLCFLRPVVFIRPAPLILFRHWKNTEQ